MGILMNSLIYNGIDMRDFGIYIGGDGTFNAPTRRGEMQEIPGRNGSIFLDEGSYDNINVTYSAFNYEPTLETFRERLSDLRSALCRDPGYHRLEDTFHPDEYRLAVFKEGLNVEPVKYNTLGKYDIVFDCKPQRFLKSGDVPVPFYAKGTITNPTLFESLPIIAVTGNGRVNVAGHLFTVSDTTQTIYIDSELMEVFIPGHDPVDLTEENGLVITDELALPIEVYPGNKDAINMNSHVEFADYDFPRIGPGEQPVAFDSGIESLVIYPRWWRL